MDQDGFQVMLEQTGMSAELNSDGTAHQDYGYGQSVDDNIEQVSQHVHGVETVGWLAVVLGKGSLGDVKYEAGLTDESVTHQATTVQFSQTFASPPRFFANIASHHGWDSSQLRQTGNGIATNQASFLIEEENCVDDESGGCEEAVAGNGCHGNAEQVAWLAMSEATSGFGSSVGYQNVANQVSNAIQGRPLPAWHRVMGEIGTATVNTNPLLVTLEETQFRRPIVFCGVPGRSGGDAVVCRSTPVTRSPTTDFVNSDEDGNQQRLVRPFQCGDKDSDTGAWCFYIFLQEPSCLDRKTLTTLSLFACSVLLNAKYQCRRVAHGREGFLHGRRGGKLFGRRRPAGPDRHDQRRQRRLDVRAVPGHRLCELARHHHPHPDLQEPVLQQR